jgi:hypothetical protein
MMLSFFNKEIRLKKSVDKTMENNDDNFTRCVCVRMGLCIIMFEDGQENKLDSVAL